MSRPNHSILHSRQDEISIDVSEYHSPQLIPLLFHLNQTNHRWRRLGRSGRECTRGRWRDEGLSPSDAACKSSSGQFSPSELIKNIYIHTYPGVLPTKRDAKSIVEVRVLRREKWREWVRGRGWEELSQERDKMMAGAYFPFSNSR